MKLTKLPSVVLLWWLGFCTGLVGLELAWIHGLLEFIYDNDGTKLSLVIGIILIWQSIACGIELRKEPKWFEQNNITLERGWFFSDVVLSFGMIGTVIGFMIMLSGFKELDITDVQTAQDMITQLGAGMSMALITTAVGLISSVALKLQFFMLQNHLQSMD
tara:strand:+ start:284 stop:766 length:483 start_codon:yes stop_codon:yes gene_type:complete